MKPPELIGLHHWTMEIALFEVSYSKTLTPSLVTQTQNYFQGYLVERKKVKANRWIRLNGDLATYHHYLVKRLVDGNTYQVNSYF